MFYECPFCRSKKMPYIVNYVPPKKAQCIDCRKIAVEKEFIKEDSHTFTPIEYYYH